MSLEIFNSIVGFLALLVALFATSKVYSLQNKIKNISKTSGKNSPAQNIVGNENVMGGRNVNLGD